MRMHFPLGVILLLLTIALTGCGYDVLVTRAGVPVPGARVYVVGSNVGAGPYLTNHAGVAHVPLITQPMSISAVAPNGESRSISAVGGSGPYHVDLTFDTPPVVPPQTQPSASPRTP